MAGNASSTVTGPPGVRLSDGTLRPRLSGIRTERWKLVHSYPFDECELFDLESDPDELANFWGRPEHMIVAANLAVRLGQLQQRHGDDTVTGVVDEWLEKYR